MMQAVLDKIDAYFPLVQLDPGKYAAFRASPMSVTLGWYEARGLGNVSLLHGTAMGGLMKMDTLVINAAGRDAPLFSYDYISAMGSHTLLVEYYDTLLSPESFDASALSAVKESIAGLADHDLGKHWYDHLKLAPSLAKKTRKKDLPALNRAFMDALEAYLRLARELPPLCPEEAAIKQGKAAAYVDGLLANGGPSTDAFTKAIGPEETRALFTGIVFGTEA